MEAAYERSNIASDCPHKRASFGDSSILVTATGCQLRVSFDDMDEIDVETLFMYLVDLVSAYTKNESVCISSCAGKLLVEMDQPKRRLIRKMFRGVIEQVNKTELLYS